MWPGFLYGCMFLMNRFVAMIKLRLALSLSFAIVAMAAGAQTEKQYHTDQVMVSGLVRTPITFSIADLDTFPHHQTDSLKITNHRGEIKNTLYNVIGVKLTDLLHQCVIDDKPRNMGGYYIVCTAEDGYVTVYSWNELFNSATGEGVWIVLSVNGSKILDDGVILINASDTFNGRRHVKWLRSVEVRKA